MYSYSSLLRSTVHMVIYCDRRAIDNDNYRRTIEASLAAGADPPYNPNADAVDPNAMCTPEMTALQVRKLVMMDLTPVVNTCMSVINYINILVLPNPFIRT